MKNDLNPALAQHKKDRQAEAKKLRNQKSKENQARLSKLNYWRVKERVDQLESKKRNSNGKLLAREVEALKKLKADLAALEKLHKDKLNKSNNDNGQDPSSSSTEKVLQRRILRKENGRGKSSIFWDPILNPYGVPPPGMPNALRNMNNDSEDEDGYETDPEVRNIPLPKGPIPGIDVDSDEETKEDEAEQKIEYSAAPVRRDIVKEVSTLVPAAVLRRQIGIKPNASSTSKPVLSSSSANANTTDIKQEEEYIDENNKQPRLEDIDDEYEEEDYSVAVSNGTVKRKYSDHENDEENDNNDDQDIYDDEDYEI